MSERSLPFLLVVAVRDFSGSFFERRLVDGIVLRLLKPGIGVEGVGVLLATREGGRLKEE